MALGQRCLGPLDSGGVGPAGAPWVGVGTMTAGTGWYVEQHLIEHCQEGKGFSESRRE